MSTRKGKRGGQSKTKTTATATVRKSHRPKGAPKAVPVLARIDTLTHDIEVLSDRVGRLERLATDDGLVLDDNELDGE